MTIATGSDGELSMRSFARTTGLDARLGGELTLYWIEGYGGGVFLPFADATSGSETYGGGRYLLDTIKGADLGVVRPDGKLVLDFNFSYFPSCAYSSRYVCPLAPSGNRLAGAVRAGERHPIFGMKASSAEFLTRNIRGLNAGDRSSTIHRSGLHIRQFLLEEKAERSHRNLGSGRPFKAYIKQGAFPWEIASKHDGSAPTESGRQKVAPKDAISITGDAQTRTAKQ
ncbi:hypothetical protein FHX15_006068 [Rhizobium sp. BK650]|nr:hypothetical protein [Rhizobium sp. BK650]